jgi:2,3-bisphosphoglycerate-independent phosphoglycerate mutase
MSAAEVTDKLIDAIEGGEFDVIVCNYANGDMVGHTGVMEAAKQAVETLDACLARLQQAIMKTGGQMLITADHGNCEQMRDHENDQAHTAHTQNLVPLVYVGQADVTFDAGGTLSDVAPTLLDLMHIEKPKEMTGRSLVNVKTRQSA